MLKIFLGQTMTEGCRVTCWEKVLLTTTLGTSGTALVIERCPVITNFHIDSGNIFALVAIIVKADTNDEGVIERPCFNNISALSASTWTTPIAFTELALPRVLRAPGSSVLEGTLYPLLRRSCRIAPVASGLVGSAKEIVTEFHSTLPG